MRERGTLFVSHLRAINGACVRIDCLSGYLIVQYMKYLNPSGFEKNPETESSIM